MADALSKALTDVPYTSFQDGYDNGMNQIQNLDQINAGSGDATLKFDQRGLWMGGQQPASAPFYVDINGNARMTSALIESINDPNNGISIDSATGQFVVTIDGIRRLLLGKASGGDAVAKLSQVGYDVTTALSNQLIWSADFNSFKIIATGSGTIPGLNNSASSSWGYSAFDITFADLGFKPIALVFVDTWSPYTLNARVQIPGSLFTFATTNTLPWSIWAEQHVNNTLLRINVLTAPNVDASTLTYGFRYYLLQETAG